MTNWLAAPPWRRRSAWPDLNDERGALTSFAFLGRGARQWHSQSGKGGIAYILQAEYGLDLPRPLQIEFSKIAQERMDEDGKELTSGALWTLFSKTYIPSDAPLELVAHKSLPAAQGTRTLIAELKQQDGSIQTIEGTGNGPIDAFVDALKRAFGIHFSFLDHHEHAVGRGADATAASYVQLQDVSGQIIHGVGIDPNIVRASLMAVLSGVQRMMRDSVGHHITTTSDP